MATIGAEHAVVDFTEPVVKQTQTTTQRSASAMVILHHRQGRKFDEKKDNDTDTTGHVPSDFPPFVERSSQFVSLEGVTPAFGNEDGD